MRVLVSDIDDVVVVDVVVVVVVLRDCPAGVTLQLGGLPGWLGPRTLQIGGSSLETYIQKYKIRKNTPGPDCQRWGITKETQA